MELQQWSAAWPCLGETQNKPLSVMTQICLLFLPTERHMLLAAALLYTSAGGGGSVERVLRIAEVAAGTSRVRQFFSSSLFLFCLVDEVWG